MSKHKVLIVEDNAVLREMIRRRLSRRGYDLSIAEDGEEGLSLAHSEYPSLVLLDMSLPVIDGWSVVAELKKHDLTKGISVIALTAHAMSGDRKRALDAGCDDYVSKPIDFELLTSKMDELLGA